MAEKASGSAKTGGNRQINDSTHDNKEHVEFQRWVQSLSLNQLLHAMECSCHDDGYGNSHEYDLLREMVQLQSPPPTPIHPRAMGYSGRPVTCKGATDGRNESARILQNRFRKPRLFQFYERRSISFATTNNVGISSPPSASNASTTRRRNGAGRGERTNGTSSAQRKRYDIFAKIFITPWGDALNVGCTEEQREADERIVSGTCVDPCHHGVEKHGRTYLSFCDVMDNDTHNNNCQDIAASSAGCSTSAASILRMLHVASRGSFLSFPHQPSNHNHKSLSFKKTPYFCAPWLDPTERWFSLPYFLASRFEVGLWEAYRCQRRVTPLPRVRPWLELERKLLPEAIVLSIQKALCDTLLVDVLPRDKAGALTHIRDTLLFELLDSTEDLVHIIESFWPQRRQRRGRSGGCPSVERLLWSLSYCPLVELGSTTDQVRLFLRQHWQSEISLQMEKQLMQTLAEGGASTATPTTMPSSNTMAVAASHRRARKKKPKKKPRKKKTTANMERQSDLTTSAASEGSAPSGGDSSGDESDDSGPRLPLMKNGHPRLSFPDNGTPFVERNRNIVLCLSTLNDIVNEVFVRVGLEVSDEESDGSVGVTKAASTAAAKSRPSGPKTSESQQSRAKIQNSPSSKSSPARKHDDNAQRLEPASSGEEKKSTLSADVDEFFPSNFRGDLGASHGSSPSGSFDTFPSANCFPPGFFHRFSHPFGMSPWDAQDNSSDGWEVSNRFQSRERSILAEFFLEQEYANATREERVIASSTVASLASSTDKNYEDTGSLSDKFFISLDNGSEAVASDIASANDISPEEFPALDVYKEESIVSLDTPEELLNDNQEIGPSEFEAPVAPPSDPGKSVASNDSGCESRSLSPEAPATPSPRLSPILLSLDDIRDIRKGAESVGRLAQSVSLSIPTSLPSSPVEPKRRLVTSLSREDLRIKSYQDDNGLVRKGTPPTVKRPSGGVASYRNIAAKGLKNVSSTRPLSSDGSLKPRDVSARSENAEEVRDDSQNSGSMLSYRNVAAKSVVSNPGPSDMSWNPKWSAPSGSARRESGLRELCARSETAVEPHDDYQNWHESRRIGSHEDNNNDNITVGKDGSTTITSAMSHRESEETSLLREERNTFRDMCLTLGAEVAKLKNQLATLKGAALYPAIDYSQGYAHPFYGAASFDPECMPPFFQKGQAPGAMSDAGIHRGEYESQVSEDDEPFPKITKTESGRHLGSGATIAGSDISAEHAASAIAAHQAPLGLPVPLSRDPHDSVAVSGLQSRLTKDIVRFLAATEMQNRKLDNTRNLAVERISRLVTALWPRAQVKMYGSHVTGLNLPSSDLDFVICLPAVHKNAPAVAPGVLEGRNAINESSQKLLARKLKGESWLEIRSMKLIERTAVPVIKVATKDTRARTMQLDISFDSPGHHGLEAIVMVNQIVEELPMIRPLVLVLKQFLLDRGLLTAYTGGLSSYCLFLMVARYLQEQHSSWGDCGSLLVGFLDFYGNCFDPRTTGISVACRLYFKRPNYAAAQRQAAEQRMWPSPGVSPSPVIASPVSYDRTTEFFRRNSFSDKSNVEGVRGSTPPSLSRPPRFLPTTNPRFARHMSHQPPHAPIEPQMDHAMPFTFDPLFVDDPLSSGNNVGRNAFRVFQVQRAFSDAHRALVASLEWDIHSAGDLHDGNDYPLLKCLLQSEDVLYEL